MVATAAGRVLSSGKISPAGGRENKVHTHIGALLAIPAFLAVLLAGTLWRLAAAHLVRSSSPTAQSIGGAMAVQY
jgi:hypothetical protein